jgi:hypothetical protein
MQTAPEISKGWKQDIKAKDRARELKEGLGLFVTSIRSSAQYQFR